MTVRSRRPDAILLVLAGIGLLGCNQPLGFGESNAPTLAQGVGGPPGPSGTPLEVSFRGDPGDAFANQAGSYVDGQDQVRAIIAQSRSLDQNGQFQFRTDVTPKRAPNRTLLVQVFTAAGSGTRFPLSAVLAWAGTGNDAQSLAAFTGLLEVGQTSEARFKRRPRSAWRRLRVESLRRYARRPNGLRSQRQRASS